MEKLRSQSRAVAYWSIVLLVGAYTALSKQFPDSIAFFESRNPLPGSWTLLAAAFIAFYEGLGWKLLNKRLDYTGYWDFEESQFSSGLAEQPEYKAFGHLKVEQTTRYIRIVDGRTLRPLPSGDVAEISRWWSISCELDSERSVISAALDHETPPERPGGAIRYAVEVLSVTDRAPSGRPVAFTSNVYHCVGAGTARVVSAHYRRRPWWKGKRGASPAPLRAS